MVGRDTREPGSHLRGGGRFRERSGHRPDSEAVAGSATVWAMPGLVNRRVLVRYRVMAYTTATLLIILVFVGIPLQIWAHNLLVVEVVGTLHGYLYLVYLVVAFDFTRKMRIPLLLMLLVLLAGTVPFAAIVAERLLTRRYDHMEVTSPTDVVSASER
jgi:integral membrane protein